MAWKKETSIISLLLVAVFVVLFIGIRNDIMFNTQIENIDNRFKQLAIKIDKLKTEDSFYIDSKYGENVKINEITQKLQDIEIKQKILQGIVIEQKKLLALQKLEAISPTIMSPKVSEEYAQTGEVIQEEAERNTHNITTNLENYWLEDTLSVDKSIMSEVELREDFSQPEKFDITYANCKKHICKLEFQQTAEQASHGNDISFYAGASDIFKRAYLNPDGSQHVVIYLSPEHTPFPDDLFEGL